MLFNNCAYIAAGFLFGGAVAGSLWLVTYLARLKFIELRRHYHMAQRREQLEAAWREQLKQPQFRTQFHFSSSSDPDAAEQLTARNNSGSLIRNSNAISSRNLSGFTRNASPCRHRWKNRNGSPNSAHLTLRGHRTSRRTE